jgi:uncharacterized repeat protein (TIGR03837 family)
MRAMRPDWDIFCNVVDNYGDIGVAWRLARALAREHHINVRLWVDDLKAFSRLWPAVEPHTATQHCEGVTICHWRVPFVPVEPARLVIEAFGCALPETYLAAMAGQTPAPAWLNLEYLSAESWVVTHHCLPSPHPRLPLTRHFFFPGFLPETGGVLIEADYATRRAAFDARAYWRGLGLAARGPDELWVSLFSYENPALHDLLDVWAKGEQPVTCLVPEGRVLPQLADWLGAAELAAGDCHVRQALRVQVLPFTDQDSYDHLLWACDLNFVRGEDSCVRAQWAARPMVWQAYPQTQGAHWDKLEALRALYLETAPKVVADAVSGLWQGWNGVPGAPDMATTWAAWLAAQAAIDRHAEAWPARLARAGRLSQKLVDFVENGLKSRAFSNS